MFLFFNVISDFEGTLKDLFVLQYIVWSIATVHDTVHYAFIVWIIVLYSFYGLLQ